VGGVVIAVGDFGQSRQGFRSVQEAFHCVTTELAMKYSLQTILFCCLMAVPLGSIFAQDPVKLSPQYYKVLIDNDEVRVLEFRFKPGEKEPMHSHPRGFVYSLVDSKIKATFPDGKSEESVIKTGEARWRNAITHAVENIGTTEAHVIAVELKKPAK
jgi:hypothetical protein